MNKKIGVGIFLILVGLSLMIFSNSKSAILFSPPISSNINLVFIFNLIILFAGIMFFVNGSLEEKVSKEEKTGLIVVTGYKGAKRDYADFLSRLREYYPAQIISLKKRGKTTGKKMINQFIKSDEIARKNLGTEKIIYLGHSLGFTILIEAARKHKRRADAYIALATYPSAGSCYNPNEDLSKNTLRQKVVDSLPDYSTLSFPLKKSEIGKTKFILAKDDPVTYRASPKEGVKKRFINYF